MNLFLHGASDFQIVRGDTLRNPAFFTGDNLATFDCVIANPPFSLQKWGDEVWASDPFGRNFAGMPPGKSGDYAWEQHMIKSLTPKTGPMAVVLPHGALFRMGEEGEIRENILGKNLRFRGKPQRGQGTLAFKVRSCNLKAWPWPGIASTSPTPSPSTVLSWQPPPTTAPRAVARRIYIISAFVQMREDISTNAASLKRLAGILGGGVVARSSQYWPRPKIHCRECRVISGTQYERLDMLALDPSRKLGVLVPAGKPFAACLEATGRLFFEVEFVFLPGLKSPFQFHRGIAFA